MSSIKKTMSALLAVGMLAASAVTAAAENAEPTMPDLTGQRYLTIDEISPGTSVRSFSETVKLSENEEMRIYNDDGIRLFAGDYIGNGASVIIFENSDIKEVYRIKLYGDLNGDGLINAADIAEMRKAAMSLGAPDDRIVSDIDADGETNIIDLIKLKNTGRAYASFRRAECSPHPRALQIAPFRRSRAMRRALRICPQPQRILSLPSADITIRRKQTAICSAAAGRHPLRAASAYPTALQPFVFTAEHRLHLNMKTGNIPLQAAVQGLKIQATALFLRMRAALNTPSAQPAFLLK